MTIVETRFQFAKTLVKRTITNFLVIHHSDTPLNIDVGAKEIHAWHLQKSWSGIGYHYVIRKDGSIERGRPVDMVGAHCDRNNSTTVGICLAGNFNQRMPETAQLNSLKELLIALCQKYKIEPQFAIKAHRDFKPTECCGQLLYEQLPAIRNEIELKLANV